MVLATSCSMDMIDRSFNIDLKYDLISFSLIKLHSLDANITGNEKNV